VLVVDNETALDWMSEDVELVREALISHRKLRARMNRKSNLETDSYLFIGRKLTRLVKECDAILEERSNEDLALLDDAS
jgi:hypothetical protein